MWEKVKLGEIFSVIRNGANIKQSNGASGIPITRIESISSGFLDESKLGYANIDSNKFENFYLLRGDILMSHINSLKHLGKTALVSDLDNTIIHGMNLLLLRANQRCFPPYIKYFFETNIFYGQILSIANQSVNQSSFTVNKLKDLEIPLPPLPIQEKIATILDKADELRRKDKGLQAKYDELAQAIFIDMFGDPVKNERGWEVKKLEELGYLKNGLNYGNNESGKELKVFGVGNFESNWLFDDYNNLKSLNLDAIPNKSFLLADGDILFVRSNGNKDLIGRAVLLKNINTEITYSGFCIKFTKTSSAVNAYYLIRLLVNSKFKKYILNGGRGANIQNINQEILSSLNIPVPPLHLQEAFAKKIELINQLKSQTNGQKSEELFQSLLQKAFNGELVS